MQPWFVDFAEAIADGDPFYLECESCDQVALPPRAVCPECGSRTLLERPLSDTAEVTSFTEIHTTIPAYVGEEPYTVVVATFDEGVRLTGQLRGTEEVSLGETVALGVEEREDRWLVTFSPT